MRAAVWRSIVSGGLVAGALDIGLASLIYRTSPVVILQSVASGVLGARAYAGGAASAGLGIALQAVISLAIAATYTGAAMAWPGLRDRWIAGGLALGVGIFVVMNYLVVPLSAAWPRHPFTAQGLLHRFTPAKLVENLLALLVFGLLVAWFAQRFVPTKQRASPS